jgi:hypothetical protein
MEIMRAVISGSVAALLSPFEQVHPLWSLVPLGALTGVALLWTFARLSNQRAIRETKRRLIARLYEFRLFVDEPKLIWKAQVGLVRDSFRYSALMLLPAVVLTLPALLLFSQLDPFYGTAPLEPGEAALVTVQLSGPLAIGGPPPLLEPPEGVVVETPAVRVVSERQISWRVRALRPVSGRLRVTAGGEPVEKSISAEPGPRYLSRRRVSSWRDLFWHPAEPRIASPAIAWVEVGYPPAEVMGLHWVVWLLIVSTATALLLRRRFHVSF